MVGNMDWQFEQLLVLELITLFKQNGDPGPAASKALVADCRPGYKANPPLTCVRGRSLDSKANCTAYDADAKADHSATNAGPLLPASD